MALEPAALTRLARLRREMDVDTSALEARAQETSALNAKWQEGGDLSRPELVLVAVDLHGYYTALETLLERVASLLDDTIPQGASWHIELLEQMRTAVPGLRPALISEPVVADIHELRKFRHFFRNAYVLQLDPGRVREQAERLARVHDPVMAQMRQLRTHLDALIEAMAT